ncbi:MAG TPA: 4Fe-4S dicluster domain-containing protein [Solirubrobacter sp.]|nr:4Fe-4S dicluster domain-containing protein [Solirubrobacter sp.]
MRGPAAAQVLDLEGFDALISALVQSGYRVIGPTVRDGAIVYDEIVARDDLPVGWGDEQEAGRYRLRRREDAALFGYAVGPHSWKRYQLPPETRLWRARLSEDGSLIDFADDDAEPAQPLAFLGVRSCELHAMGIMERVLGEGAAAQDAFLVAVQCGVAGGTCFCASMGTGPRASDGFDLALTELIDDGGHRFVVEAGTRRGAEILDDLPSASPADAADAAAAEAVTARTAAQMGRTLDADGVHDLLLSNLEHPRWDDVAERCLTCGNCTMVCPTCFCTTVEDITDLDGHVERHRRWDSCFTIDYSRMHGGSARTSSRSRYRQWLTHKLATWIDQFGTSGCVGCGRCITWCPVGIDITEEVAAIGVDDATS